MAGYRPRYRNPNLHTLIVLQGTLPITPLIQGLYFVFFHLCFVSIALLYCHFAFCNFVLSLLIGCGIVVLFLVIIAITLWHHHLCLSSCSLFLFVTLLVLLFIALFIFMFIIIPIHVHACQPTQHFCSSFCFHHYSYASSCLNYHILLFKVIL
jgi:hypothetical protein